MTPPTLPALQQTLGLSGRSLARLAGIPPRTMQHYLAGERQPDGALLRLLAMAARFPAVRAELERMRG